MLEDFTEREHHVLRIELLAEFAVDAGFHVDVAEIDLADNDARTDRRCAIEAFHHVILQRALLGTIANGPIVEQGDAPDILLNLVRLYIGAPFTQDDRGFTLVIEVFRTLWVRHVVARSTDIV